MAQSEGYIRERSPGSYTITIWLGKDAKGKPQQLIRTVRGTKKEAEAERARLILERDQGIDLKPQQATVNELITRWLETKTNLEGGTPATYRTLLKIHVRPVLGNLKIKDVRPLHIEAVKTAVLAKGRTLKSALNVFRLVDAIFARAVLWGLLGRNPCDAVEAPHPKRFVPETPTPEALNHLLSVADSTAYGPVARTATLTSARQGELLRMLWRDVDWQNRRIRIRGTKTDGSAHTIDIGDMAIEVLRNHRMRERERRLLLGPEAICGTEDSYVFTNMVGKKMDAGGLKRTWKRIVRDANVGHIRFHDLRHASATYQIQAGIPIPVVSQRLGHTRTSTTSDIYAHVLPGMGRQAAEVLERVLRGETAVSS